VRIRVLQQPAVELVDGIDLRHFVPGQKYEVGTAIGALMLAEGWAAPLDDGDSVVTPFSDHDPFMTRTVERKTPPNLTRVRHSPLSEQALAADFERRRRPRGRRGSD